MLRPTIHWLLLSASFLLNGCTSGAGAWFDVSKTGIAGIQFPTPQFDSRYRYLQVGVAGQKIYLILGYVQPHPMGDIDVWYSGSGEVIKIQNGRVVGTAGLPVDWREVRLPQLPAWQVVSAEGISFQREVDLMPGYRFGRVHHLHLRRISAPQSTPGRHWPASASSSLQWFEEGNASDGSDALPPSRYAVDLSQPMAQVVYSEQCLSKDLCLTFEPVPPARVAQNTALN